MYIGMIGPGMEPEQTGTSDTKQECNENEVHLQCAPVQMAQCLQRFSFS